MWWYIAVFVAALAVSYSLAPKPPNTPPVGFNDVKVPTAEDGRELPVVFGTRSYEAPNCGWFGDYKNVAIRKKGGKK